MSDNILYEAIRDSRNYDIIIKTGNRKINAQFEKCDAMGILLVLEKDKTEAINSYSKREKKTFIPWGQIKKIEIP